MPHAASAIRPDTDHPPTYRHFCEAVARAQLAAWLPSGRRVLVDVSGRRAASAELAARAGHTVLRVLEAGRLPGRTAGAGARGQDPPADRRLLAAVFPAGQLRGRDHC